MYKQSQILHRVIYSSSIKTNKIYRKVSKKVRPARVKLNGRRNITLKPSIRIKLLKRWSIKFSRRPLYLVLATKYTLKRLPILNLIMFVFITLLYDLRIVHCLRSSSTINLSSVSTILGIPYLYQKSSRYLS